MSLTDDEMDLLADIQKWDRVVREAQQHRAALLSSHRCKVVGKSSDGATCVFCHRNWGWFCSKSPDNACHYFTEPDGSVRLINGTNVDPPEGHDPEFESYDWCIYCEEPDERK